jgi:hypothetical protein
MKKTEGRKSRATLPLSTCAVLLCGGSLSPAPMYFFFFVFFCNACIVCRQLLQNIDTNGTAVRKIENRPQI